MKKRFDKHLGKALAIAMSVSLILHPAVAFAGESEPAADSIQTVATADAVTIEDEETAKAAKAETKSIKSDWWILALAAVAGISVEEYLRRRNSKVD